eukprot:m.14105 g.14105  ORF g.14105 m.14105 type:complete len:62 (+) comp10004_c1_seq1:228-413(+)
MNSQHIINNATHKQQRRTTEATPTTQPTMSAATIPTTAIPTITCHNHNNTTVGNMCRSCVV